MANLRVGTGITFDGATGNINVMGIGTVRGDLSVTGSMGDISVTKVTVGSAVTINNNGNLAISGIVTASHFQTRSTYDIDYLLVAGGGQGGDQHGGGGGAGGLFNSCKGEMSGGGQSALEPLTVAKGTVLTITIGAGSGNSHPGTGADGADGADSSIARNDGGSTLTVSGGGGGAGHADGGATGRGGGSSGGSGLTGSSGGSTVGQGFDGGDNPGNGYASWPNNGAGGGGAGGPGGNPAMNSRLTDNNYGNFGGEGVYSSITGAVVGYAGGGGGGSHSPHDRSSGIAQRGDPRSGHQVNIGRFYGGADGGLGNSGGGSDGTANTGGGGGGSGGANLTCGGGGSGVCILRMPTVNYSGTTTGSPTVTTVRDDTVVKFTGSGTYTA